MILVLILLFELVNLGIYLMGSSLGISFKLHGLRVLSPGYVTYM